MPDQILIDIIDEHLPYEIDMLRDTYSALAATPAPTGVCKHALIKSFCVHARSLIAFFAKTPCRKGDAVAGDFTAGFVERLDPCTEPLKSLWTKLNKQIFHLTKDRTILDSDKFDPGTDGTKILQEIERELLKFRNCLLPDFKHFKCKTSPLAVPLSGPPGPSSYSSSTVNSPTPKTGPTGGTRP